MSAPLLLRRTLLVALASLAVMSPAALARPADAAPAGRSGAHVLQHTFDPYPTPQWPVNAALAQERYYSSYGEPTPLTEVATATAADTGDGIARLPFVLAVIGALIVGLGAGSGLHLVRTRRRQATGLAT
jgi:hypothetical protein